MSNEETNVLNSKWIKTFKYIKIAGLLAFIGIAILIPESDLIYPVTAITVIASSINTAHKGDTLKEKKNGPRALVWAALLFWIVTTYLNIAGILSDITAGELILTIVAIGAVGIAIWGYLLYKGMGEEVSEE